MFTLYKKRDFSDYVSDTFQFFRETGKHYFRNYFTICGVLLMVLVVLSYFLFQLYFDFFLNFDPSNNNAHFLQNLIQNNAAVIFLGAIFMFLFIILLSMLNYSIPVIYMDLYDKNKGNNFETKDILNVFKSKFGRIIVFFLGLIFLITPLLMFLFVLLILLCFILIGIPMLLFFIPAAVSWITLSFYEYFNHDKGFFESLGNGFKHLKNQFFPNVGALMIMYIIIQISMSVFTIIPYMFGMASMLTSTQNGGPINSDSLSTVKIMLTIVMVISMLMSYVLNNLLLVNQGLVYYSRREYNENISSQDSIDLIGSE